MKYYLIVIFVAIVSYICMIVGFVTFSTIVKAFKCIKFNKKYPIMSISPPTCILSVEDNVLIERRKMQYVGIDRNHGDIYYVFLPEDQVTYEMYTKEYLIEHINEVYCQYGVKWLKVK